MNNVPAVAAEASLRRAARETGNRSRPIGSAANRTHIYSRPNLAVAIAPAASPRGTNHMLYLYARIRDFSHGTFVEIKERKKRNEKKPRICVTRRNCANRYSESSLVLAREFLRDFIPFPTRLSTRLDAIRRDSTRFDAIRRDSTRFESLAGQLARDDLPRTKGARMQRDEGRLKILGRVCCVLGEISVEDEREAEDHGRERSPMGTRVSDGRQ